MKTMLDLVRRHKSGEVCGAFSVCSAHPIVLEATLRHAKARNLDSCLIEATSNQVNQDGGYTGMQPADFRDFVFEIAQRVGYPAEKIVLGGDHLGPNAWTDLQADQAMGKADVLIDQYVRAGFRKIHLDCSMSCADDPVPLSETAIADRATRLCKVSEAAYADVGGEAPVYVVGTEVPVPGGAAEDLDVLAVTSAAAAQATITMHEERFPAEVWPRVIGCVVQPGVEFDHHKVVDYNPPAAAALAKSIESHPSCLFEAHSTDYQTKDALSAMVRDHFAILKVGPGVTYALREALWALDAMERELLGEDASQFRQTVIAHLQNNPGSWKKYYNSTGNDLLLDLQYSLSDRIRYYWPAAETQAAMDQLFANLRAHKPSISLISQYLPAAYDALRAGEISTDPVDLIVSHIFKTLDVYYGSCDQNAS